MYYFNILKTERSSNTLLPSQTNLSSGSLLQKTSPPLPFGPSLSYTPDPLSFPPHSHVGNSVATESVSVCLWTPSNGLPLSPLIHLLGLPNLPFYFNVCIKSSSLKIHLVLKVEFWKGFHHLGHKFP